MNGDMRFNLLLTGAMLILPISALIARRVPLAKIVRSALSWIVIFALGLLIVAQRDRFDPYLTRIASVLKLDGQTVVGGEVRIRMAADGHFWARVSMDGTERRMLVDSGATVTALSEATAHAVALDVSSSALPTVVRTANGAVTVSTATVGTLKLGDITARELAVVVSPAFGDTDVLGMNFLSRLRSWRVEDQTLILTPKQP